MRHTPHAVQVQLEADAVAGDVPGAFDRHVEPRGGVCLGGDGPNTASGVLLPGTAPVEDGPLFMLPEVLPQARDAPEARGGDDHPPRRAVRRRLCPQSCAKTTGAEHA